MLRAKFFLTLLFVSVILSLVADHQVTAAPEPCHDFMRLMKPPKKEPVTTPSPTKDPKKEKCTKLKKLLEKLAKM